jgi:predicted ATPase
MTRDKQMKIVLTGGPGGGKTTALDLFRRELLGQVAVIPESATAIFEGGIQKDSSGETRKAIQKMIFHHQKNVEAIYEIQKANHILLCDRGTLDGLAYWPGTQDNFFKTMKTSFERELKKYDAVIFFETGAASGKDITTNNPYRDESSEEAIALDKKLQKVWKKHPNFYLVKSNGSFIDKIMDGIEVLREVTGCKVHTTVKKE